MIIDAIDLPDGFPIESDVCVVGSGPAGIALALRMARDSRHTVTVLESGGLGFEDGPQALAAGDVIGQPYFPLIETRIRALGGSSASWAGLCAMMDAETFAPRPWLRDARWPFPRSTLEPYYEAALKLCGVAPVARADADRDVAERARRGSIGSADVNISPIYLSRPLRFGATYREDLRSLANVRVYLHATATEIMLTGDGTAVAAIRVLGPGGRRLIATAQHYVLAAGGIENARLLLASDSDDPRGVGNRHDLVGRFLMEHPRVTTRYRPRPGNTPLRRALRRGPASHRRLIRAGLSLEAQSRHGLLGYRATLALASLDERVSYTEAARRLIIPFVRPWAESPYVQDAGGGRMGLHWRDNATVVRRPDRGLRMAAACVRGQAARQAFLQIESVVEQLPDAANRVELTHERDAIGMRRARIRWTVGELEATTYRRSLAAVLGHLDLLEPGIARTVVGPIDPWPDRIMGSWHHIGTTTMAADPLRGVVDPDCRVHGVDNLYVAGSSVFSASGSVPPTLTIVMLSLRLASHLRDRLRRVVPGSLSTRHVRALAVRNRQGRA